MEESYIRGVNSELIRAIKELGKKLDTIAQNQSEVTITADAINLNTDELEDKLDSLIGVQLKQNFLNPTHLGIVSEGDTTFEQNVVLCNITDNNITVTVTAADDTAAQSIVLTPGWNPAIVKAITGVTANTLIYGW
jgi:hypothetical protein